MKILIVGGAGYVGSRLVPVLVNEGHIVTVVDLLWFGNNLPKSVRIIKKDIFALDESSLAGFDQVIFLGGLSNDPMAEYSPADNFIYNSAAPAYLAYIAKRANVKRYIYACSGSVYGCTDKKELRETDSAQSLYPYGISKRQGEFGVLYYNDKDFSVISLRKGTVSGWSPRMRFDLIVNTMYMKAMTDGKITINNASIWRPIISIADTVEAYRLAVHAPLSVRGIFNVASGNYTVGEVGEKVAEHFEKKLGKKLEVEVKAVADKRDYKISTQKARKVLGFKPTGSIESILEELDERVGKQFRFKDEKHYNILVFKKVLGGARKSSARKPSKGSRKK